MFQPRICFSLWYTLNCTGRQQSLLHTQPLMVSTPNPEPYHLGLDLRKAGDLRNPNNRGITLVEIVIVVVITSIVALLGLQFWLQQQKSNTTIQQATELQTRLKQYIRVVKKGLSPAGYGLNDVKHQFLAKDSLVQVAFIDEFDKFGCNGDTVVVSYFTRNDTLYQKSVCTSTTRELGFATDVDTLFFEYFDEDGVSTTVGNSVKVIRIFLGLRSSRSDQTRETTISISPVNF